MKVWRFFTRRKRKTKTQHQGINDLENLLDESKQIALMKVYEKLHGR